MENNNFSTSSNDHDHDHDHNHSKNGENIYVSLGDQNHDKNQTHKLTKMEIYAYISSFLILIVCFINAVSNENITLLLLCLGHFMYIYFVLLFNLFEKTNHKSKCITSCIIIFLICCMLIFPGIGALILKNNNNNCNSLDCWMTYIYAIYYIINPILSLCGLLIVSCSNKNGENNEFPIKAFYYFLFIYFKEERDNRIN